MIFYKRELKLEHNSSITACPSLGIKMANTYDPRFTRDWRGGRGQTSSTRGGFGRGRGRGSSDGTKPGFGYPPVRHVQLPPPPEIGELLRFVSVEDIEPETEGLAKITNTVVLAGFNWGYSLF